jgi:hypothetical protein
MPTADRCSALTPPVTLRRCLISWGAHVNRRSDRQLHSRLTVLTVSRSGRYASLKNRDVGWTDVGQSTGSADERAALDEWPCSCADTSCTIGVTSAAAIIEDGLLGVRAGARANCAPSTRPPPPITAKTPAGASPHPAARGDPVFVFHGRATQWCMISKTETEPYVNENRIGRDQPCGAGNLWPGTGRARKIPESAGAG